MQTAADAAGRNVRAVAILWIWFWDIIQNIRHPHFTLKCDLPSTRIYRAANKKHGLEHPIYSRLQRYEILDNGCSLFTSINNKNANKNRLFRGIMRHENYLQKMRD
jgi:hypothetical protein